MLREHIVQSPPYRAGKQHRLPAQPQELPHSFLDLHLQPVCTKFLPLADRLLEKGTQKQVE